MHAAQPAIYPYPCAECPGPLDPQNVPAFQLFADAATKVKVPGPGKSEHDEISMDWSLARLILESRGLTANDFERVLAANKSLNNKGG